LTRLRPGTQAANQAPISKGSAGENDVVAEHKKGKRCLCTPYDVAGPPPASPACCHHGSPTVPTPKPGSITFSEPEYLNCVGAGGVNGFARQTPEGRTPPWTETGCFPDRPQLTREDERWNQRGWRCISYECTVWAASYARPASIPRGDRPSPSC